MTTIAALATTLALFFALRCSALRRALQAAEHRRRVAELALAEMAEDLTDLVLDPEPESQARKIRERGDAMVAAYLAREPSA